MKKIAIYILATLSIMSCGSSVEGNGGSEVSNTNSSLFLEQTEIGIFSGNTMIKIFDKSCEQIIFDDDKSIYVVSNVDYSAQFTLSFDGGIYLDNLLTVDLEASGLSGVENIKASTKVVKVDSSDQRYWLWDSDLSVGFIVDFSM